MQAQRLKQLGAYYTPDAAVAALIRWAVHHPRERMLDPSAGDGRFLALHKRSVGVETDPGSAVTARTRAPWALVHEGDFFQWAEGTKERFECAAGNPPFIRYQRFAGEERDRALRLCARLGAEFSSLTSSWAPFLVAAASLLKPGGRMAFVVPAEIGHAPYAAPLIRYLLARFADVRLLAVREKVFSELSEDVWLLYADGFGNCAQGIMFSTVDRFEYMEAPPTTGRFVTSDELERWNFRLRPFLLPREILALYRELSTHPTTVRLGEVARVGIGYVTGANDFFHLRPTLAKRLRIPESMLHVSVRNGRMLPETAVTRGTVEKWLARDEACLLLKLQAGSHLPESVRRYLDSEEGVSARSSYKCRMRDPWYSVPDVTVPHGFLAYMSSGSPGLIANRAGCAGTNSVHTVQLTTPGDLRLLQVAWSKPLTTLSCEIEGHPLGGGMLKIEPREAQRVAMSFAARVDKRSDSKLLEGLHTLRRWRHCHA